MLLNTWKILTMPTFIVGYQSFLFSYSIPEEQLTIPEQVELWGQKFWAENSCCLATIGLTNEGQLTEAHSIVFKVWFYVLYLLLSVHTEVWIAFIVDYFSYMF